MRIDGGLNVMLYGGGCRRRAHERFMEPWRAVHRLPHDSRATERRARSSLVGDCFVSLRMTTREVRNDNSFSWGPMLEVAKLFAGIFITIAPVIAILKAGNDGALAPLVAMVTNPDGQPNNVWYFWLTGRPFELPRQCADVSRVLQSRGRRPRHLDGAARRHTGGYLLRRSVHGRQHLYRQRAQLHGQGRWSRSRAFKCLASSDTWLGRVHSWFRYSFS